MTRRYRSRRRAGYRSSSSRLWDAAKTGLRIFLISRCITLGLTAVHCTDFSAQNSEVHQEETSAQMVVDRGGDRYALLVNGNTDGKGDDVSRQILDFGYESLKSAGYSDEDLIVLESGEELPDYVDGEATIEGLEQALEDLESQVTEEDAVLLFIHGHGSPEYGLFGESQIRLSDETLTASEFWDMYDGSDSNYTVAAFHTCFGEGFAATADEENVITMSPANHNKSALFDDFEEYEGFSLYFFSAIGGQDPAGNDVDADFDGDGRISVDEIFTNLSLSPYTEPRWYGLGKETPQLFWQAADPEDLIVVELDRD